MGKNGIIEIRKFFRYISNSFIWCNRITIKSNYNIDGVIIINRRFSTSVIHINTHTYVNIIIYRGKNDNLFPNVHNNILSIMPQYIIFNTTVFTSSNRSKVHRERLPIIVEYDIKRLKKYERKTLRNIILPHVCIIRVKTTNSSNRYIIAVPT